MATKKQTPDYFHCISDPRFRDAVYEPEADTFLLLDALDGDEEKLAALSPRECVEIGCGSGTVITHLAQLLLPGAAPIGQHSVRSSGLAQAEVDTRFSAVDINPLALEAAALTWNRTFSNSGSTSALKNDQVPIQIETAQRYGTLSLFEGDLFSPFRSSDDVSESARACFDVVIFNPPYVPTSEAELNDAIQKKDVITAAWCGGPRGRVVVDRFLEELPAFLSPYGGICYVVAIKENDVEDVKATARMRMQTRYPNASESSIKVDIAASRYTGEHLSVVRIQLSM